MKIGWPHRLLTAVAVLMLGTWASHQALRQGWASYQSIEARAVLKRSPETGGVITAQTWSRARAGFMSAIEWDPGNPEYHQGIADLYMIRLWLTPGDRVKMAPYFADLVKRKIVDPQEAYAKAGDKVNLISMFKRNNIDTSWAPQDPSAPATPPAASGA